MFRCGVREPDLNQHAALVRFRAYANLGRFELGAMMPMVAEQKTPFKKGAILQAEGGPSPGIHLLLEGWTASSMMMPEGRRRILKVHLPGDLIGLPGLSVAEAPDTVVALTNGTLARIDLKALGALFRDHPRVAALLFLISQEERLMLMDRLALVGQRKTVGRLAGLLLQLHARMLRHDPGIGDVLDVPLTQADLGDMVGVTTVHVNRALITLRKAGLVSWTRGRATLHDRDGLRALSGLPDRTIARNLSWLPDERQG